MFSFFPFFLFQHSFFYELFLQQAPVFVEIGHGVEEQVGSLSQQGFIGKRSGIYGNGKDACGYTGLYSQRCVFHDDGLVWL